jgi:ketosteroid isomerase-like protein
MLGRRNLDFFLFRGASMSSCDIQDAIMEVVDNSDFRPLFDHFADDVELRVAVAASPISHERRGRERVLDYLMNVDVPGAAPVGRAPDLFASGDRFVAFVDGSVPLGTGVTIRSGCALVFDVREGTIVRLGIHYELSPEVAGCAERVRPTEGVHPEHTAPTTESSSAR